MSALKKIDKIKFEELRGFEKAAILLNYLGKDATGQILAFLTDADIRKLIGVMGRYRVVPVEITKKVLEEYYEMLSESHDYIFPADLVAKDNIVNAVGEERARGILGHLTNRGGAQRSLESLEVVDAKSLSNFLINEHPQTIAVILAHLEPEKKQR